MARVVWKGAITFGLVHIPITLRAAAKSQDLDFDWLDKRDMAPVGYQRINKRTREVIDSENIVKGYQYEPGEYVLMSDEDFKQANAEATQTIDIIQFVDVADVPPWFFETPYYLEAGKRGEKGYALLRETLRDSGKAGLANVVIYRKQHLALLMVVNDLLMLNTMRWGAEILEATDLNIPPADLAQVGVRANEVTMATQLVGEMSGPFDPAQYRDTYREDLLKRIDAKIAGGDTHLLTPPGEEPAPAGAQVIDLMAALKASLAKNKGGAARGGTAADARPTRSAASEKRAARGEDDDDDPPPRARTGRGSNADDLSGSKDGSKRSGNDGRKEGGGDARPAAEQRAPGRAAKKSSARGATRTATKSADKMRSPASDDAAERTPARRKRAA
ncbi:MAG: Ku protein [Burkholderiaceae bacterium]|jgi:DNA end-binding protein Ku|nr:Ku protein [Burkholderiaceae bacterium]